MRAGLWPSATVHIAWSTLLTGAGLFTLFVAFLATVQFATPNLAGNDGYYHIKLAYLMRTENLRPAFDWLPLTRLFFYNTHNTYTLGLDPTYMQLRDPKLYDLWVDIGKGRVERPAATVSQAFGAGYVLTDLNHKKFLREAGDDPSLVEVYHDDYATIFQVVQVDTATQAGGE